MASTKVQTSARPQRHAVAAALLAVVVALWIGGLGLMVHSLRAAADETGRLVAVFPLGWSLDQAFGAIVASGGLPVRPSILDSIWVVQAAGPGVVTGLRDEGAWRVLREVPAGITLAGCLAYQPANTPPERPPILP